MMKCAQDSIRFALGICVLLLIGCTGTQVEAISTAGMDPVLESEPANPPRVLLSPAPQDLLDNPAAPLIPAEPRTVQTEPPSESDYMPLSLSSAIHIAMRNSTVLRDLGGRILEVPQSTQSRFAVPLQETDPRFGVQNALSEFDAQLSATGLFENNDRPLNNIFLGGGTRTLKQDFHDYTLELTKPTAAGSTLSLRSLTDYDANNAPGNRYPSVWQTSVEAEMRQPLLRGAGTTVNRIIGRRDNLALANGIAVARIRSDISQVDFEIGIRAFVSDVVNAYWDLYYAYRVLDSTVEARDQARDSWQVVDANAKKGRAGVERDKRYLLLTELYRLESEVQNALSGRQQEGTRSQSGSSGGTFRGNSGVYLAERRLRRMIGLPITDSSLIRPSDEPSVAELQLDWHSSALEAVYRRPELKKERLRNKQLKMIVTASKNYLLPQLDAVGTYRWRGLGRDLFPQGERNRFNSDGTLNGQQSAVGNLIDGDFQEWNLGIEFSVPIGFRRANAAVHHAELQLARQKAILQEQEQEVLLDLSNAVGDMRRAYAVLQNNYNQVVAATELVEAIESNLTRSSGVQFDLSRLTDAHGRLMSAKNRYQYALVEYAIAIKNVHFEKGSLPDYFDVMVSDSFSGAPLPGVAGAQERDQHSWAKITEQNRTMLREQLTRFDGFNAELEHDLVRILNRADIESLNHRLAQLTAPSKPPTSATLQNSMLMLNAEMFDVARELARYADSNTPEAAADADRLLGHIDVVEGVITENRSLIHKGRDRYLHLLDQNPSDYASANNALWITLSQLNDVEESLDIADQVRASVPVHQMPRQLVQTLSKVYLAANRPGPTKSLLMEAIDIHPDHARFRYQLANAYLMSNEPPKALVSLVRALESSPSNKIDAEASEMLYDISHQLCRQPHPPKAGVALARTCLSAQLTRTADLWAKNALRSVPPDQTASIEHLRGDIALVDGISAQREDRLRDAAKYYAAAYDHDRGDWVAANNLISLRSRHLGQHAEAVDLVETILSDQPVAHVPVKVLATMSTALRHAQRNDRAAELLELAINDRPADPELHFQLALTHFATGNPAMARQEYDQSVRLGLPPERLQAIKQMASVQEPTQIRPVSKTQEKQATPNRGR